MRGETSQMAWSGSRRCEFEGRKDSKCSHNSTFRRQIRMKLTEKISAFAWRWPQPAIGRKNRIGAIFSAGGSKTALHTDMPWRGPIDG